MKLKCKTSPESAVTAGGNVRCDVPGDCQAVHRLWSANQRQLSHALVTPRL